MPTVWNRPVTITRGILSPAAGDPETSPPASGATITIYDSTLDGTGVNKGKINAPFSRLVLKIFSSHDSGAGGVVFNVSQDGGAHWRQANASTTYTNAAGETTYDFNSSGATSVQIKYTNSANSLTAWEMSLVGIVGDRALAQ